jgi:hypothetical protein
VSTALALACVAPAAALAQTVEIKARPRASLFLVTDRGRVSLGTLNGSGELDVPRRLIDTGKELEVVLESSADGVDVALVERGRIDPVCGLDAPRGMSCVRTGTYLKWGTVEKFTVSEAGHVTLEGQQVERDEGMRWGVGGIIAIDGTRAFLPNDDRLCREARSLVGGNSLTFTCVTDSSTDAFGVGAGLTFLRFVSLNVGYLEVGSLGFQLTGEQNGTPVSATGRIGRTRGPTFTGAVRADVGWPVVPFVEAGAWRWATNVSGGVSMNGALPTSVLVTRSLSGWNPIYGGGIEFWPARYVGIHTGVKWIHIDQELPDLNGLLNLDNSFRMVFVGLKFAVR